MKLRTFKPSLITKQFFPEFVKDPKEINYGQCFIWAYLTYCTFDGIELWDTDCHAFVKYRGRFYDSEVLRGSPDWQDLPATEYSSGPPARRGVSEFKREWTEQTKRFKTSWGSLEYQAKKLLNRYLDQVELSSVG